MLHEAIQQVGRLEMVESRLVSHGNNFYNAGDTKRAAKCFKLARAAHRLLLDKTLAARRKLESKKFEDKKN